MPLKKKTKKIDLRAKIIGQLLNVTGLSVDSWNSAIISDDMKLISYIRNISDTWNPSQLNEALKLLGFRTVDTWNPAQLEETKNNLVQYFLPKIATGNPIELNLAGNIPYTIETAKVTMLPIQSGSGDPSPTNIRPISGRNSVEVVRTGKNQLDLAYISGTENSAYYHNISTDYKLKANVTYTLSFDVQTSVSPFNMSVGVGTESGSYSADVAVKNNNSNGRVFITFTPTQEQLSQHEYLKIRLPGYASQTTFTYSIKDIQLELGSTATDYEPYQGETYTATFPSTVYYADVDLTSGNLESDGVLDNLGDISSSEWGYATDHTYNFFYAPISVFSATPVSKLGENISICEIFKSLNCMTLNQFSDNDNGNNTYTIVPSGAGTPRLLIRCDSVTTVNDFVALLSGKKICFRKATPTETTLTPQSISLNKGENVINSNADNIELNYKINFN